MNQSHQQRLFDLPGRYSIRIQGQLKLSWFSVLDDLVITMRDPERQQPVTTLTGEFRDQAALMSALNALYDMGCPLLGVERLDSVTAAENPGDCEAA